MVRSEKGGRLVLASVFALLLLLLGGAQSSRAAVIGLPETVPGVSFDKVVTVTMIPVGIVSIPFITLRIVTRVSRTGAISVALGDAVFGAGRINGTAVTATQTSAWSGQLEALLSANGLSGTGILLRFVLPNDAIEVRSAFEDFFIGGGSVSALATISPTPLGRLVTVSSFTFTNRALDVLGLRVTRVVRTVAGFAVGASVGQTGTYSFSPGIVVAPA